MMAKEQRNILIVDDEENIRNLLHHILERQGYHCEEAATADQALEQIKNSPVDLVLLDIMMPDQSGTKLLSQIKERYPDIMVIMATATQDMDTAVETIRHGAYDYITKPFNLDVVIQSVKRALEKRKLECDLQEYKQHLEDKVEEQAKQIRETSLGAMRSLSFALEANDRYTAGHSRRVTEFSLAIGRALHLSKEEMENLRWGSMLHDIGKIAVDPRIINKPRKLTREEYAQVMTHTMVGASIVGTVIANKDIIGVIEHHHDRYDGNGLNQILRGENIPFLARIVSVADAYDAMTSVRPYRAALSRETALAEINNGTGKQFDPTVAKAFVKLAPADLVPQKKTILVVDDEPSIRMLAKSMLSSDYTVIEATNGQEAVEITQREAPSVILMDILMPKKDGLQACHEIKSNPATKSIPLIMLTAIDQELNRKLSAELGADQYIAKPFNPQEMLDVINKLLQEHK